MLEKGDAISPREANYAGRTFSGGGEMQQVFWNVLKNAVKFTPEAGKIRVETFSANGQGLGVKITDTGIGMTPGELDQVFTPFSQGEHTSDKSANFGGLGLGVGHFQEA